MLRARQRLGLLKGHGRCLRYPSLLLIHHLALAAGATLYRNLPYDTVKDFEPLGLINQGPYVIVSKTGLETRTLAEFIEHVKKSGRGISFGTAGVGSTKIGRAHV